MIPQEELERLLSQATKAIDKQSRQKMSFDNHTILAELYFNRADIHLTMKNYRAALSDYQTCLDYDAYFYEAVTRMDKVIEIMLPVATLKKAS